MEMALDEPQLMSIFPWQAGAYSFIQVRKRPSGGPAGWLAERDLLVGLFSVILLGRSCPCGFLLAVA